MQRVLWRQTKNLRDIYATDNVSGANCAMEAKVFFEETCMDNVSGANSFIGCDSSFFEETCMDNVSGSKSIMEAKKNLRACMDNVSGAKSVKHGGKKTFFYRHV